MASREQGRVVVHPLAFRVAAKMAGAERRLQAGEYRFADSASPAQIVERLARGDVYTRAVTFREGLTIWDMAEVFQAGGLGTAADFLREARDPARIQSIDPDARSLEGYLFPDTYQLPRSAGAKGTVDAMVAGFLKAFDAALRAAAVARGLSVREVVTIASLVEKETAHPPERPIVSAPAEPRTVEIPIDKQRLMGVRTVVVAPRQIGKMIRTAGRVEYDERRLATVNVKFEGWIEKLYADYTGKQVRKGDPLAEVYSPELLATQQEFLNTLRWAKSAGEAKEGAIAGMLNKDADATIDAARQRLRFWDITASRSSR